MTIYDSKGSVKYIIDEHANTDCVTIMDSRGNLVYRYNKSTNTTLDKNGSFVMRGSILLDLK